MQTSLPINQIEFSLHRWFSPSFSIPNIYWPHECDLLILKKSGYITEVEIKRSLADLKQDAQKPHQHISDQIRTLYFAIPDFLLPHIHLIPERAGVLTYSPQCRISQKRKPVINKLAKKIDLEDQLRFFKASYYRMWNLKHKLI